MHLVFVYGTLKKGQPNNYLFEDPKNGYKKYIGKGITAEKVPLVIASQFNIPFMLHTAEDGKGQNVEGDIYEVDDQMLSVLDKLESHPHWYQRIKTQIIPSEPTNQNLDCWCYFLTDFKPDLLNLQRHSSYDAQGDHGLAYVKPSNRHLDKEEARQLLWSEVKLNINKS